MTQELERLTDTGSDFFLRGDGVTKIQKRNCNFVDIDTMTVPSDYRNGPTAYNLKNGKIPPDITSYLLANPVQPTNGREIISTISMPVILFRLPPYEPQTKPNDN